MLTRTWKATVQSYAAERKRPLDDDDDDDASRNNNSDDEDEAVVVAAQAMLKPWTSLSVTPSPMPATTAARTFASSAAEGQEEAAIVRVTAALLCDSYMK
jgi:hypothetical protein